VTAPWPAPSARGEDGSPGAKNYARLCQTCHGATGHGDGPGGLSLQPRPRDFTRAEFKFDANHNGTVGDDEDLALVIRNGAAAFGGSPMMSPKDGLTDREIEDLITQIRGFAR
jgi:mono/diheme cytochrome c family protein